MGTAPCKSLSHSSPNRLRRSTEGQRHTSGARKIGGLGKQDIGIRRGTDRPASRPLGPAQAQGAVGLVVDQSGGDDRRVVGEPAAAMPSSSPPERSARNQVTDRCSLSINRESSSSSLTENPRGHRLLTEVSAGGGSNHPQTVELDRPFGGWRPPNRRPGHLLVFTLLGIVQHRGLRIGRQYCTLRMSVESRAKTAGPPGHVSSPVARHSRTASACRWRRKRPSAT
ncbi:MAG: hypothetical protein Ct9H300mP1_23790 [Planctomycetaceae bacterium]|nr:MAG: hypothetical protein Ct9H300mP1_23790 [Planctomycetaceae bacterium]